MNLFEDMTPVSTPYQDLSLYYMAEKVACAALAYLSPGCLVCLTRVNKICHFEPDGAPIGIAKLLEDFGMITCRKCYPHDTAQPKSYHFTILLDPSSNKKSPLFISRLKRA